MATYGTERVKARRARMKEAGFVELKSVFVPEHMRAEISEEIRLRFATSYPVVKKGAPKKSV